MENKDLFEIKDGTLVKYDGTRVTIPDGVKAIDSLAFGFNDRVVEVYIPASVEEIGWSAFSCCHDLKRIVFGDNSSLKKIGAFAFSGCRGIEEVRLPESLETIGGDVFANCVNLKKVEFEGNRLECIWKGAFSGCTNLRDIVIPEGVSTIGIDAFKNCDNLTTIAIPSTVTEIGNGAFKKCDNLTDVHFGGSDTCWADVKIGRGNKRLECSNKHFIG